MSSQLLGAPVFIGPSSASTIHAVAQEILAISKQNGLQVWIISGGVTTPLVLKQVAEAWSFDYLPTLVVSDERHSELAEEQNVTQLREVIESTPFERASIIAPECKLDLVASAHDWSRRLAALPKPDIALLSMAEDGHVAGLFSGIQAESISKSVEICRASPKPPACRISLTSAFLRKTPHRLIVAIGENKARSVKSVTEGVNIPIEHISPSRWFVDAAALGEGYC
jgi:6-phosphogluconolactonase